ncbi:MAG: hypothetical protein AAGD25_27930 [Cyanobacteria bacterium P01_F01_bin.150]
MLYSCLWLVLVPSMVLEGSLQLTLATAYPHEMISGEMEQFLLQRVSIPNANLQKFAQTSTTDQTGWDLYKAQDYQGAIARFKADAQADPNNPKPYWGMTLAHNKLAQYSEAKVALDRATELDPSISFTKPDSYSNLRTTIEKNLAQSSTSTPSPAPAPSPANAPTPDSAVSVPASSIALIPTLGSQPVFTDASMQSLVDANRLAEVAADLAPFNVKFAVVEVVVGERQAYAQEIFNYLNITNGAVIIATRNGVDIYSDRFDPSTAVELAKKSRVEFTPTDYTEGLARLAQAAAIQVQADTNQRNRLIAGAIAALGLTGGGVAMHRRQRWQSKLTDLDQVRTKVATTLYDLQDDIKVLPENASAQRATQLSEQATETFLNTTELLDQPPKNWQEARQVDQNLTKIQQWLRDARVQINQATGVVPDSTQPIPTSSSNSAPNPTASGPSGTAVSTPGITGACFFCSRPQPMEKLYPRLLKVGQLQKQVLCCLPCADQVDAGQAPPVRTVKRGDRYEPWYRDRSYDPNRDYHRRNRDWHSSTIYDTDIEFEYEDERVIIYADQPQYRDYQVDAAEQYQPEPSSQPPHDTSPSAETDFNRFSDLASVAKASPEASTETDFFWANQELSPEPDVAEVSGDADFFNSDIS